VCVCACVYVSECVCVCRVLYGVVLVLCVCVIYFSARLLFRTCVKPIKSPSGSFLIFASAPLKTESTALGA